MQQNYCAKENKQAQITNYGKCKNINKNVPERYRVTAIVV